MRSQVADTLGARIRKARKEAGFKNAESFAVALGVSHRTVQRWEAGEGDPSIKRLNEISRLTAKSLGFFLTSEIAA